MIPKPADSLTYEEVRFRGIPALFTSLRVSVESVPKGLRRYELRHDEETYEPCQIAKGVWVNHYGTLLTAAPIQLTAEGRSAMEPGDLVFVPHGCNTIAAFLQSHPPMSSDVIELFPIESEEWPLFFSALDETQDKDTGCIGHLRGDFDGTLHTTWWPHYWDQKYNQEPFMRDIQRVMNWLRADFAPLNSFERMDAFCKQHEHCRIPGQSERCYGFCIETGHFRYMLRCTPLKGWYHVYLYCYSKEAALDAPAPEKRE